MMGGTCLARPTLKLRVVVMESLGLAASAAAADRCTSRAWPRPPREPALSVRVQALGSACPWPSEAEEEHSEKPTTRCRSSHSSETACDSASKALANGEALFSMALGQKQNQQSTGGGRFERPTPPDGRSHEPAAPMLPVSLPSLAGRSPTVQ